MRKRMVIMLVAVFGFLGAIGTVKFKQIQAGAAQAASFQPPPETVTTIVARQEQWPATIGAIGTVAAVHGVTVSADRPASWRRSPSSPAARSHPGSCSCGWTRARNRLSSPRPKPSATSRGSTSIGHAGCVTKGSFHRPSTTAPSRRAQAGGGPGGGDPRDHRAQADPRSVRGHPGHPPGEPRPVPERRRPRRPPAVRRSDLRQLLRPPAGGRRADGGRGPGRGGRREAVRGQRQDHGRGFDRGPRHAQCPGAGHVRQSQGRTCTPACS